MASGLVGRDTPINAIGRRAVLSRRVSPGLAERRLVLFTADQLALVAALVGSGELGASRPGDPPFGLVAIAIAATWWAIASAFDSYDLRRAAQPHRSVITAWVSFGFTLAVL